MIAEKKAAHSAISPGQITIADEAGQSAAEAIASVNREVPTGDNARVLRKSGGGQALMQEQSANAQIAAAFGHQGQPLLQPINWLRAPNTTQQIADLRLRPGAEPQTIELMGGWNIFINVVKMNLIKKIIQLF